MILIYSYHIQSFTFCFTASWRRSWGRLSVRLLSAQTSWLSWRRPDDAPPSWIVSLRSRERDAGSRLLCSGSCKSCGLWPRAKSRGWLRATERLSRARQSCPVWRLHWPCYIYERWRNIDTHVNIVICRLTQWIVEPFVYLLSQTCFFPQFHCP